MRQNLAAPKYLCLQYYVNSDIGSYYIYPALGHCTLVALLGQENVVEISFLIMQPL